MRDPSGIIVIYLKTWSIINKEVGVDNHTCWIYIYIYSNMYYNHLADEFDINHMKHWVPK